ncbi:MAG TPA: large-conductance mechanosensitive channel protein MscL [Myxococcota bacterium]|nr:large-conductance mechanosensitive channel protein MscL [Myxococcota bacterium]
MSVLQEFRDFAMRGNVVDLAVGVVIGAAFGKITTSLVNDVIMPPLGLVLGGADFSDKAVVLKQAAGNAPSVTLKYGIFINAVIDFLIVAAAIFAVVKVMNSLRRQQEAAPAPPSAEVQLLTEIRDSLRKR